MRTVEGKHPRRDLRIRDSALYAGEALAEVDRALTLALEPLDLEQVLAVAEGHFQRIGEALLDSRTNREPVDDHLDGVALVLVERRLAAKLVGLTVDLD